jgi:hypothetical protein
MSMTAVFPSPAFVMVSSFSAKLFLTFVINFHSFLLLILLLLYSWSIFLIALRLHVYSAIVLLYRAYLSQFLLLMLTFLTCNYFCAPQEVKMLFFIPVQVPSTGDSFKCCQTGKETEHINLREINRNNMLLC